MQHSRCRGSLLTLGIALLATSTGVAGCYAEATTGAVVRAEYAPAHVEVYPHEYYEGRTVYLVGDRWYYRDGPHWVYYVNEPRPLVERRIVIRRTHVRQSPVVHQAPPAQRHRHRGERRVDRRDDRHDERHEKRHDERRRRVD